jgi:hypothetical protein
MNLWPIRILLTRLFSSASAVLEFHGARGATAEPVGELVLSPEEVPDEDAPEDDAEAPDTPALAL